MGLKLKPTGAANSIDIEFESGLCLRIYDYTGRSHSGTVMLQGISPEGNATGKPLGVKMEGSNRHQIEGTGNVIIRGLN